MRVVTMITWVSSDSVLEGVENSEGQIVHRGTLSAAATSFNIL